MKKPMTADPYAVKGTFDREHPLDGMLDDSGKLVEKPKHQQALRDYAFMGPARSLPRLHKRYAVIAPDGTLPPTRSLDTLKYWSICFDWQRRIAVWDQQEADRDMLEWEARKRVLREQDWNQGAELRDKVGTFLEQLPRFLQDSVSERSETLPDGSTLKTRVITVGLNTNLTQLANAMLAASKLQRLATDEPTDHLRLSGAALDSLIEQELARARDSREAGIPPQAAGAEPQD